MKNKFLIISTVLIFIILSSFMLPIEGASRKYLPIANRAVYYNYADSSIYINANRLKGNEIYNFYIDLNGDHTSAAVVYSPGIDLGVAYITPDGVTIQFTWGATASRTYINGFPCVMRAIKKEMTGNTPVGEWFKWTLTKYRPPTNGIVILHASNSYGTSLPINGSFYWSIDDCATWNKFVI